MRASPVPPVFEDCVVLVMIEPDGGFESKHVAWLFANAAVVRTRHALFGVGGSPCAEYQIFVICREVLFDDALFSAIEEQHPLLAVDGVSVRPVSGRGVHKLREVARRDKGVGDVLVVVVRLSLVGIPGNGAEVHVGAGAHETFEHLHGPDARTMLRDVYSVEEEHRRTLVLTTATVKTSITTRMAARRLTPSSPSLLRRGFCSA